MAVDKQLKARVCAELFRCALAGEFLTYAQFFNRIRPGVKMGNFAYQTHFNEIAKEERENGYPDITFIVRGSGGYRYHSRRADGLPGGHDHHSHGQAVMFFA
jgi:hypothetical protein